MQIKVFDSFHQNHINLYEKIAQLTQPISEIYPDYVQWYREKFIPGLLKKERMYIVAQDEERLAGCVLIKKTAEETKICTFFVHPQYRKQGLGTELMKRTLAELKEPPLMTVSSRNLSQLLPLLNQFGFHWSASKKQADRIKDIELYFNDQKADAIKDGLIPVLKKRMAQLEK